MMRLPSPRCELSITKEQLSGWLSHTLEANEQADLDDHVSICAACQATVNRYRFVARALRNQPIANVGDIMWPVIRARLPRHRRRAWARAVAHPVFGRAVAGMLAVSVIAAFLFVFARFHNTPPTSTSPLATCTTASLNNLGVFVARNDGSVQAFAANDGTPIWQKPARTIFTDISAPVLISGVLLVPSFDGALVALHPADGAPLWTVKTVSGFQPAWSIIDPHSIAAIENNGSNWSVASLKITDGTTNWRMALTSSDLTIKGVTPITANSDTIAVLVAGTGPTGNDFEVFSFRARDGSLLWHSSPLPSPQNAATITLAITSTTVYALSDKLYAFAANDGHTRWTSAAITVSSTATHPLAIVGDTALVQASSQLLALHTVDGTQAWATTNADGNITLDGQTVYVGTATNQQLLALNVQTGTVLWHSPQTFGLPVAPIMVGCHVIIAAGVETAQAFDQQTGQLLWSLKTPLGFQTKAAIVSSAVILGLPTLRNDTTLAAYQLRSGKQIWLDTGAAFLDDALYLTVGPRT